MDLVRSQTATLPGLWLDWCQVTGTPTGQRDEPTLARFASQTRPSKALLKSLAQGKDSPPVAWAWPRSYAADTDTLSRLLRRIFALTRRSNLEWISRLRLHRLAFLAVLIAPAAQGGLGLTRGQSLRLSPAALAAGRLPDRPHP